jgi:hypothetical protein
VSRILETGIADENLGRDMGVYMLFFSCVLLSCVDKGLVLTPPPPGPSSLTKYL